jgi:large subunit ribosomal protein L13
VDSLSYKTISTPKEAVDKKWFIIDAKEAILGRLSSKVASIAKGKHKPSFTPNVDCGDKVIVINAEKIALTGKHRRRAWKRVISGLPGACVATISARVAVVRSSRSAASRLWRSLQRLLPDDESGIRARALALVESLCSSEALQGALARATSCRPPFGR